MKEFKLYVGQWEDNMTEVLHAGLKNDPVPEAFTIRSVNEAGLIFPTRYIKIEPLSYAPPLLFKLFSPSKPELCTKCTRTQLSYFNLVCSAQWNKRRILRGEDST